MRNKNKLKTIKSHEINKTLFIIILIIILNILIIINKFYWKNDFVTVILNFLEIPEIALMSFLGTKYMLDRRII